MSFPRYPKYKDSGVEWLGEVPEHWSIEKFRHRFIESPEKIENEVVGPMLSVSGYRGIEIKEYDDENRRRLDEELIGYRIARPGQLVVNSMWLNAAGLGVSAFEGHVSPAYRCYWIDESLNRRYVHHLMRCSRYVDGYTSLVQGIRPNSLQLSRDDLMTLPILIPSEGEQLAIASFLDSETAKIDALIAEQQRLIELLQEKRQAVISHAVTKGLNPDAPMKDSGIEWLGEVPAHWEVATLRRLNCLVQTGPFGSQLHAEEYIQGGTPVVNPTHMVEGRIVPSDEITVANDVLERLPHQRLKPGDVVFSRRGELGRCALVTKAEEGWLCGTGSMILRLNSQVYASEYLSLFLSLDLLRQYFESNSVGSVMDSLSSETLLSLPVIMPPIAEQRACALFARQQSEQIDGLKFQSSCVVSLLQERRSALISAAVTGQIDVRGLAPKEAA